MPSAPTKLQRWLDVVSFLASRRFPVAREDLWNAVPAYALGVDGSEKEKQTVRRMFERDKDELKKLGIPIETLSYSINYRHEEEVGYRLARKDFHLPYLKMLRTAGEAGASAAAADGKSQTLNSPFELTEAEAGAALDGLRELASIPGLPLARSARSAFRKLAFDMDPTVSSEEPVLYAPDPEGVAAAEVLQQISGAIRRCKSIAFRYHSMSSDTDEEREVFPYGLLFQHGRWYLIGHDTGRDGVRMYRVGRMRGLAVHTKKPGTADYVVPDDFSLESYAGRKAWELGPDGQETLEATVHFRFPRSLWAARNGHGTMVEEDEDGAQRRRFLVHRRDPFLRWVLSLAGDARIEAPDDLAEEFRVLVARVGALHDGGSDHG